MIVMKSEKSKIFQCSLYDNNIQQYLPTDLSNTKSLFNFYNISGQNYCNVIRKFSNFIFYMLKKTK